MTMGQGLCIVMESTELFMTKQRNKKTTSFFCYGFLFWLLLFTMHIDTCEEIFVTEQGLNHQLFQVDICWQPPLKKCIIIGFEVGLIKLVISPFYFL